MASALFAVSLVCLLSGRSALASDVNATWTDHREETFVSAKVGDNVTLSCFYEKDQVQYLYWFKETPAQNPRLVSSFSDMKSDGIFHDEFKDNPRFTLGAKHERFPLKINSVELSDSTTYLCLRFFYREVTMKSFSLHVWGSALNIRPSLHQWASDSLHPDGSLNLSCQVPAKVQHHPHAGNYNCSVVSCAQDAGGVVSLPRLYFLCGPLAGALAASLAFWVCKMTSGGKTGDASTSHNDNAKEIQDSDKMYFPVLLGEGQGDQTWSKCAYYCKKQQ